MELIKKKTLIGKVFNLKMDYDTNKFYFGWFWIMYIIVTLYPHVSDFVKWIISIF